VKPNECDILYLALFPNRDGNLLNEHLLAGMPNRLTDLMPSAANRSDVVRVLEAADLPHGTCFQLHASNVNQEVICYVGQK